MYTSTSWHMRRSRFYPSVLTFFICFHDTWVKLVKDDIIIHGLRVYRDEKSLIDDKGWKIGNTWEHRKIFTRTLLFSRQRLPDDTSEVSLHLRNKLKCTERFDIASLTKWLINHSCDKKYCFPSFLRNIGRHDRQSSNSLRHLCNISWKWVDDQKKRQTDFFFPGTFKKNSTYRLTKFLDYK